MSDDDNEPLDGWVDMGHAYSWSDLINQMTQARPQVFRERSAEVRMRAFAKSIRREWRSMEDYLKYKLFAYDVMIDAIDNRQFAQRPKVTQCIDDVKLVDNDFPYWFEPDIDHKVMWSESRALDKHEIEQRLDDALGKETERIWLLNSIAAQSVRGLWHIHVFIRRKNSSDSSTTSSC
jgi:hypothetical protein